MRPNVEKDSGAEKDEKNDDEEEDSSMEKDEKDNDKKRCETGKQKHKFLSFGDRIAFFDFGTEELEKYADFDIHFITNILSFQRQFLACKLGLNNRNADFDNELLGQRREDENEEKNRDGAAENDDLLSNEDAVHEPEDEDLASLPMKTEESRDDATTQTMVMDLSKVAKEMNLSIPQVNAAQSAAVEAFLGGSKEAKSHKIHIVQGYVKASSKKRVARSHSKICHNSPIVSMVHRPPGTGLSHSSASEVERLARWSLKVLDCLSSLNCYLLVTIYFQAKRP